MLSALLAGALPTVQPADLIDTRDLGERGATFEAPRLTDAVGAGDIDGDSHADLLLLGREPIGPEASRPYVLLARGRADLVGLQPASAGAAGATTFRSEIGAMGGFDVVVQPAGDVDGDGLADFLIGFSGYPDERGAPSGACFLVHGSASFGREHTVEEIGRSLRGVKIASTDPAHRSIGAGAAVIGDVDGDGRLDLAVGAPRSTNARGEDDAGIVFMLLDAASLQGAVDLGDVGATVRGAQIHGMTQPGLDLPRQDTLGTDIRGLGDMDGDGFHEFSFAAWEHFPKSLHLVRGGGAWPAAFDIESPPALRVTSFTASGKGILPGRNVAALGDLDGDGRDDIGLGYARTSFSPTAAGDSAVRIIHGGTELPAELDLLDPPTGTVTTTLHGIDLVDGFGKGVAAAGDVNGDGIPDIWLGASSAIVRGVSIAGEAYVLFGARELGPEVSLREGFAGWRLLGSRTQGALGKAGGGAGDVNGDGAGDVIVVEPGPDGGSLSGRAHLIHGTGAGPPPLRVYEVVPPQGGVRGGAAVTVRGSGLTGDGVTLPRVFFGDRLASRVLVQPGGGLLVTVPPAVRTGTVDVTVEVGGASRTLAGGFTYTPDFPQIDLAALEERGTVIEGDALRQAGDDVLLMDLDRDGASDLVLASRDASGVVVSIVLGGADFPTRLPLFEPSPRVRRLRSLESRSRLVASLALLGDVNGDGRDDLGLATGVERAFVFFGRTQLPEELVLEDEVLAGGAVAIEQDGGPSHGNPSLERAGDVNGDGIDDIAVALPGADTSFGPDTGEILYVAGGAPWPERVPLFASARVISRLEGTLTNGFAGAHIASAGDADGDGHLDLLASTVALGGVGRVHLLAGQDLPGADDLDAHIAKGGGTTIVFCDGFLSFDGINIAAAGDVNSDGLADLLFGIEGGGAANHGATYLVPGRNGLPAQLELREEPEAPDGVTRIFGAAPLTQSGRVAAAGDFNADGFADFLVASQPDLHPVPPGPWTIFVGLGAASLPPRIDLVRPGAAGFFIHGVPGAVEQVSLRALLPGDVDRDGQPDFAFAAGPSSEGAPQRVYVVHGPYGGQRFTRADANFDGRIEISDAVFTLAYLFLGGEAPLCADAADADDDGRLLLTDAVYLLGHLFLGGPPPREPFPEVGADPTGDELGCRGF